ncbi:DNA-binding protein [Notoacmeibacter ruber]|uniref:DNA-binding protein n=1 Tax=Notoacmeibacter ruber TaxID=2670375 RepID=A0A3L7JEV9_9HYPH|nr:DNA-binding protein [Notoacmeibacter ruber]
MLPAIDVRRRYGVSHMTVYRWQKSDKLDFPDPIVIAGRKYWYVNDLIRWEQSPAARGMAQ